MREIPRSLQSLMTEKKRIPDYKVYAYKVSVDPFSKIIKGQEVCSPLDITDYCSEIGWSPVQLTFTLKDVEGGIFHPDSGMYKDYLADGCCIRLKEGDTRLPESQWVWTFTGSIKGQLGWIKTRKTRQTEAKVSVYARDNALAWKKRLMTTKEYSMGTDLGIMFGDIAFTMGLTEPEVRVPKTLGRNFYFKTNQIAQKAPWESLNTILETVMQVPFFDGEGKLACWSKNLNRESNLILPDFYQVHAVEVVSQTGDAYNKVRVVFLDANLSKVESPYQKLGQAEITTGFFTFEEKLPCYWSEDRKQRASGTTMKTIKGVNDNLIPVGTESYQENDLYHGTITVTISMWVPMLVALLLIGYVAATLVLPDKVVVGGAIISGGITIPVGRLAQAGFLAGIMIIMMCLGSAQYEIWGTPYDLVYLEKQTIAIVDGLNYWDENELKIENDFIGTHDWCDTIATTELCFQQSVSKPRRLIIDDYLGLEIGDIVQLPDGRKFFINDMKKNIKRGQTPVLDISGFKVLTY